MIDISKFNREITDFRNGVLLYEYSFNPVGNLFFKSENGDFNQSFLKIPVDNFEYDVKKIGELYNLKFEEFSEATAVVTKDPNISSLERTVEELENKLAAASNSSDVDKLSSEILASKDLIIQLRISAGEGSSADDFYDEFPYFPKKDSSN
jgi:hypothetical protein